MTDSTQYALQMVDKLAARLFCDYRLIPVWGCELEWYCLSPLNPDHITTLHQSVTEYVAAQGVIIESIVTEKGQGQYETAFPATRDVQRLCRNISFFRKILQESALTYGIEASFAAKPFADDYGSALQAHIHLEDTDGKRVFVKQDELLSDSLKYSVGGLLEVMAASMPVFAPFPESYARFVRGWDAPTTISWGGNNRTTAIRLPLKTGKECHIEHRVAGADAEFAEILMMLLVGILHGLSTQTIPIAQIYGNASDTQYRLSPLPTTPEAAYTAMQKSNILPRWLNPEILTCLQARRKTKCATFSEPS